MLTFVTAVFLCLLPIGPAAAHGAETHTVIGSWTFDAWIIFPLALSGILYINGSAKLWARARGARVVLGRRALSFAIGWIALAGALVSPLHWLGEHLFTFHMIEHEIVMAISAPLIVISRPAAVLLWGLPTQARRQTARLLRVPMARSTWSWISGGTVATVLHGLAIWGWHAPPFFDAAVTNDTVHRLQHLSFFATGILFWWSIVWRSGSGIAAWHLFLTMLHMSVLGALMALAPHVLYLAQTRAAQAWGLTPLEDQQLAGMIMWIPAGTIYAGAALFVLAKWISSSGRGGKNEPELVRP